MVEIILLTFLRNDDKILSYDKILIRVLTDLMLLLLNYCYNRYKSP